ncbi:hypothetical protein TRFO_06404 [Tritrichomonas foetus]|uniref:Uncharacterized protein n=1 Tax=Tritrichomonas foetus TaxID=1144522 RepID=A0A1J4JY73_9EUKA|nr:hypothetical protein TRFO_06404 [Tritrichomonas foetus]|eukprot:OHT04105.1 hypothetical protein TRFO_06404 [Tritrichomonas foetus]
MLWSIEIVVAIFFGFELTLTLAKNSITLPAVLSIAVLIGQYIFAWIVFLTSSTSQIMPFHGSIATIIQGCIGVLLFIRNREMKLSYRVSFHILPTIALIASFIFFTVIMDRAMMKDNFYSIGAGFGDFPFHLNIMSSFAHGVNTRRRNPFDTVSVFYAGEPLAYPVMTNFYTASLMLTGGATQRIALFIPSLLVSFTLMHGLYTLSYYFSNCHKTAALSLFLFLNLGGLGFTVWHNKKYQYGDYVFSWGNGKNAFWFHPIMHVLVPQRASLYSMPLCYWTLYILIIAIKENNNLLMILAGIMTGLLPQFQIHAYASIAQWSIFYCLLNFPFSEMKKWFDYFILWCFYGLVAIPLGLPQFYPFLSRVESGTKNGNFLSLCLIYAKFMRNKNPKYFFIMWWEALGVFGIIAFVFGLVMLNKTQWKIYLSSLGVWAITQIVLYQPWELDNMKLIYNVWVPFACPIVAMYFMKLFKRKWSAPLGLILLFFTIIASMCHTIQACKHLSKIMNDEDFNYGLWLAENTDVDAIFASSTWHANPVGTVAGRQIFCGYGGWIISHGLEYGNRNAEVRRMTSSPSDIALFNRNGVKYVTSKREEFPDFDNMKNNPDWHLAYNMGGHKLWKRISF